MSVSKAELRELKKAFAQADMVGDDWTELPEGKYQFKILGMSLEKSGNNRLQVRSDLEVVGGNDEVIGATVATFDGLETLENIGWFKRKLARLGYGDYQLDDLDTVQGIFEELAGAVFDGQVKHKDGFQNIYVNQLVAAASDIHEEEGGEETETEEDPETEETEWSEGDSCIAPFEDDQYPATIVSINDSTVTVADEDGEEWEVDISELEASEEESENSDEDEGGESEEASEEEGGEEESGEEEGSEEEGGGEESVDRFFPTLDEIGKMTPATIQTKILAEVGITAPPEIKKSAAKMRKLGQTIVALYEDDDFKSDLESLKLIVQLGPEDVEPANTSAALEEQCLDYFNAIAS